ncbi:hypothetical protein Ancab_019143 [Ancistrocladus abbreviatus]
MRTRTSPLLKIEEGLKPIFRPQHSIITYPTRTPPLLKLEAFGFGSLACSRHPQLEESLRAFLMVVT